MSIATSFCVVDVIRSQLQPSPGAVQAWGDVAAWVAKPWLQGYVSLATARDMTDPSSEHGEGIATTTIEAVQQLKPAHITYV